MKFDVVSEIHDIETIAIGKSIRVLKHLNKNMAEAVGGRKRRCNC